MALALLIVCATLGKSQGIVYTLLPGSTITPVSGSTPTGPAESLTGTFEWFPLFMSFTNVSLDFTSDSYHLTLATNGLNSGGGINSSDVYFAADVNISGLSLTNGVLDGFVAGSYIGPMTSPTFLTFPDLRISPEGGGIFVAQLTILAQQVPEPSSASLLLYSTVFYLAVHTLRRIGAKPNKSPEPTPVGAFCSAARATFFGPAWFSFFR